jgi:hypothetical protein
MHFHLQQQGGGGICLLYDVIQLAAGGGGLCATYYFNSLGTYNVLTHCEKMLQNKCGSTFFNSNTRTFLKEWMKDGGMIALFTYKMYL